MGDNSLQTQTCRYMYSTDGAPAKENFRVEGKRGFFQTETDAKNHEKMVALYSDVDGSEIKDWKPLPLEDFLKANNISDFNSDTDGGLRGRSEPIGKLDIGKNAVSRVEGNNPASLGSGEQFGKQEAISYFESRGISRAGAIGIVANLVRENNLKTTGAIASQGELGLAQWKTERYAKMVKYAASHVPPLSPTSKDAQAGYLIKELKEDYPGTWAKIEHATDPVQAAQDFCAGFEMPTLDNGQTNVASYEPRRQNARDLMAVLSR